MPVIWRFTLIIYNLLLFIISLAAVALSLGAAEPVQYINKITSNADNLVIIGTVGVVLCILSLVLLYLLLKTDADSDKVLVEKALLGEISMSKAAIKLIILKAVRQVEGVRETHSIVKKAPGGIIVTLHMMINTELNVPELTVTVQQKVKESLENIGGLQIAEIKVLVDDLNAGK